MSWSGSTSVPNWGGQDNASGGGSNSIGDLYIVPDPATTEENPSIGLEGRNEVPLPTKYRDLEVKNLTAENINGNTDFDASKWSLYPAITNVTAVQSVQPITPPAIPSRIYDITGFRNIECTNLTCSVDPFFGGTVTAPNGQITTLNSTTIVVDNENELGTVSIYGAEKVVGTNALFVEGGTTLTGGGDVHGVTIGALRDPTGDVDLVRIDVLPTGLDLVSATYVTIDSSVGNWATAGALSMASGGALSLAGGSYIEYNSDQHYFINTSSGNDYTDIYVGNIFPANGGSANLRINGGNQGERGVELADVKTVALYTELPYPEWSSATDYAVGTKVKYFDLYYNSLYANLDLQPNAPIPAFVDTTFYNVNNIVFQSGEGSFRCISPITPPSGWIADTQYDVNNQVAYGGLYYNCGYLNFGIEPTMPIPVWVSGTSYFDNQVVAYAGDTYIAIGFPDPYIDPSTNPNWSLLFTGTDVNNIWAPFTPTSAPPPSANWEYLFATNEVVLVWAIYYPYGSLISGDRYSAVNVGSMASNVLALQGKSYQDATLGFESSTGSLSTIRQINSTGEMQINTAVGLTIDTTTATDFSAGDVNNVKTLNLTSVLYPLWSQSTIYAMNDVVERDGFNWRSEISGNRDNLPQTFLSPWLLSSTYLVGNVRYDTGSGNAYICINDVSGSTTPPSADPTHWAYFQMGMSAEDVWYSLGAVVSSQIVGDRLSGIQVGQANFVNNGGGYLTITQDPDNTDTQNAFVQSAGSLNLIGTSGASLGSQTGIVGVVGETIYIQTLPAGDIQILADDTLQVGSNTGDTQIASTNANVFIQAGAVLSLTAEGNAGITSNTGSVAIVSTLEDVSITSDLATSISAGNSLTLNSVEATNITSSANTITINGNTGVQLNSPDNIAITSSTQDITITGNTDVVVVATTNDISLTAGNNINLSAGAGDKVIVNSTLDLTNDNVINANTITGQGALTLATTGATNLNLSPATGGVIVANKGLNLSNNNITNANTITGQGALTLATTGATNLNLSPDTGGVIQASKNLDMGTIYGITNCISVASANALGLTANNGNVNLTATGTGNRILLNSDASMGNRTLFNFTGTNVGGIYGLTTQALVLAGQQTVNPAVQIRGSLTMWQNASTQGSGNSISGVTTLNGRNIFSYGNFYNTATQTLGAINTATRIQMNTSANNNLITLDTTTNIGRITFTNAGVYQVSWNGYLVHGGGSATNSYIWIRLNGTDVAGSGKKQRCDAGLNDTSISSSSLVNATAGQYIEFFWSADGTNVPLTSVGASAPVPAIPSFSCVIEIIG